MGGNGVPCMLPMRTSLNDAVVDPCVLVCMLMFSCNFLNFSARVLVFSIVLRCLVEMAM